MRNTWERAGATAAKLGVTKLSVNTDGRRPWTRVHGNYFEEHAQQSDFWPPGKIFVQESAASVEQKSVKLGLRTVYASQREALSLKWYE